MSFLVGAQYLNTNHTLYAAVKRAEKDGHLLTKEAHRAAHNLRIDFEKGGIHLPSGTLPSLIGYILSATIQFSSYRKFLYQFPFDLIIFIFICFLQRN